jgi:hypothetical protein
MFFGHVGCFFSFVFFKGLMPGNGPAVATTTSQDRTSLGMEYVMYYMQYAPQCIGWSKVVLS